MAKSDRARARIERLRASDAQIDLFISKLERLLDKSIGGVVAGIKSGKTKAIEVAALLGSLEQTLEKAGLSEEIKGIRGIYADELRFIREELGTVENPFTSTDKTLVESLITFDTSKVETQVSLYTGGLKSSIMRSVIVGEEPNFSKLSDTLGSKTVANIATELRTGLMGFSRTVTVKKSLELGFNLFEYLGPDDKITREFCSKILDRSPPIYTIEEIKQLDNEQGLDVFTYGGGYNCRHQWSPISADEARKLGYKG